VLAGRVPLLQRMYWNPAKFRAQASGLRPPDAELGAQFR
jgi:hypothetical protein